MLSRWAEFVGRRAAAVVSVSVVVVLVAAVFGVGVFSRLSNGGFEDPGSESAKQFHGAQDLFGSRSTDVVAMYSSDDLAVTDPQFESVVDAVVGGLPADSIAGVTTYYDTKSPDLVSDDGHATMVLITLAGDSQDTLSDSYTAVKPYLTAGGGLTTHIGGQWAVFGDVNDTVSADIARAESLTMPIVFILSLLIFGSLVAALMPTLVGSIAVFGAFAVVRLISMATDVSIFAINIITLIGMGLAIDYALFIVSRFREELDKQPDTSRPSVNRAIAATMTTAGRTVLFSGLTVAASMASLVIFPQNFLRSMGYGGVAAVIVAMTAALTVLPATLALLGKRIEFGRMPWRRGARARLVTDTTGVWSRIAHSVMRRPAVYLVVIVVGLGVLSVPFFSATWGSVDERVLPTSAPSRVATAFQTTTFGAPEATAEITVKDASGDDLATYERTLGQVPGVTSVQEVATTSDGAATLLQVSWLGDAQTTASQDIVKDLRAIDPGDSATALIGGTSAQTVDLIASIKAHLLWMGLLVVAVMLVLLFLAFGSVVLPIKAVVMNAISIMASFGIVTWIFADGHLSGLLGFESPGYLDVTQPILMLAILFGLSMDYEVFLLSRIREAWDETHDNTTAVATGLQRSGRIITSAALLLAVVIGGFATSGIVFLKMIGVGMLVAVLLDATVVRALLVPATMRLLGRANWWAPAPLARWWERHGVREYDPPAAEAEREPALL